MVSGRGVKVFLIAYLTSLSGLVAAFLYLYWQHESDMRRMMGDMMPGMMTSWMPLTLIAILAVAAFVPIAVYWMASDRVGLRVSGLTASEQAVVNYLLRQGGQATQKEIAQALNISRLKAHRLVASLKRRGVVITTPHGRTNKVTLTKNSIPEHT